MSDDLDNSLRKALRPVDPGESFTARVLARLAAEAESGRKDEVRPVRPAASRFVWWPAARSARVVAALAASLVIGVAVMYAWHAQRERAGLEARDRVIEALRVTSEKLDIAYQIVNNPPPAPTDDEAGV